MSHKKSWKLQEFVAHSADVQCLHLGPTSGRVMVTGGQDKKVNVWAVGKPEVILSLSGHTSPVECVQFNNSEELVCAGSQAGTLKIWDLEAAKIVRTLSGHKANIRCVDFHPYGEFVASGSMDTTVRLWDVRRKGCIVSYKGHTNTINHLRFSPDGRWVMSAGEDGLVKLWDLNAGKLLADFILHTGPVNRVEFHPREFLVATGSSDRTVKFWDLETFGLVSSTDVEASPVRTICFHPDGLCLFSGGIDSLRAYSWEPSFCYESQLLGWGKVSDMAFSSNQLIGASYNQTNVSVWVANMADLEQNIARGEEQKDPDLKVEVNDPIQKITEPVRKASPQRKSFNTRPKTTSSKPKAPTKEPSIGYISPSVEKKLNDPNINYQNVFQPQIALNHSPEPVRKNPQQNPSQEKLQQQPQQQQQQKQPQYHQQKRTDSDNNRVEPSIPQEFPQSVPQHHPAYHPPVNQQAFAPPPETPPPQHNDFPIYRNKPAQRKPQPQQPQQSSRKPPPQLQQQHQQPPVRDFDGLNLDNFSQVKEKRPGADEENTLDILEKSHHSLCQIMQARLSNLVVVSRLWTEGDIKGAVETAGSMSDLSVFVDIINVLHLKQALWSLDLCSVVLPTLRNLFSSNYECYVEAASSVLKLILKSFSQLIKSTLSTPPGGLGVDLSREERYKKCDICYKQLQQIKNVVSDRTTHAGRIGNVCRELSIALKIIEL